MCMHYDRRACAVLAPVLCGSLMPLPACASVALEDCRTPKWYVTNQTGEDACLACLLISVSIDSSQLHGDVPVFYLQYQI
ncbi:hypothetical protein ASPBRDRAFT_41244 [Aspergillus brasiliensis CBS 101740]|uniref:Uncharacterized protein n=1 Tax=Aspergillus brasiliensis (strain CBS 101740 / IMI 381727 / IBT 21946) TaxID=767769 RepID=A0A1L9UPF4_ASPBC|nr:hypothetical protein ASPBRDRAFT_41244 [Aspergillus brasiliensis CBS 101740]